MADNDKKKSTKKVEKREGKNKKSTKVVDKKESSEVISPIIVEKESTISDKNASFVQRLGAYLIDMFLILLISSIVTMPFTSSNNYEKLSEETNKVVEEYTNGKIDMNTYMNRVSSISYDMARETGLSSIIMIAVYVLYFIVYQYYNKGQPVGKKLMKIRIVLSRKDKRGLLDIICHTKVVNVEV